MLMYQKKSSRRIVHYSGCRYLKTRMDDRWGTFDSLAEAHAAGYRLCKCCSPIARHYRLEQKQILRFSAEAGLSCYQSDGCVKVTTPYSRWKIITSGRKNFLFLYHQNTNPYWKEDSHGSIVPGYHSQAIRKESIVDYMKYIVEHDAYRQIHPAYIPKSPQAERAPAPKGSKRWRKERRKETRLKRRGEIRHVMNLIDQLQAANYERG